VHGRSARHGPRHAHRLDGHLVLACM
jgi:hypothetical protein